MTSHLRALPGIDTLVSGNGPNLKGEKLGLILHPASVTADLTFSAHWSSCCAAASRHSRSKLSGSTTP